MAETLLQQGRREIQRITWLGLLVNGGLTVLKLAVGLVVGSMALVADGVHSISDVATDLAVILGSHLGSREPDPEHPYGHGRFETFSALFVAVTLVVVGAVMIEQASAAIAEMNEGLRAPLEVGFGAMAVAAISIAAKEALYWLTRAVARKTRSAALFANAWHHRSDAFSSVAVLIGFVAMRLGYEHGDQVATVMVGLMVILVGVRIIGGCWGEFTERAVDEETMEQIRSIIDADARIRGWHQLRTRTVGREIFVDLHILVDPSLDLLHAHGISDALERRLRDQMSRPMNIMVHVEPDLPELRHEDR